MLLEICANSHRSAINAQIAGADRIELCTELSVGGLTPSLEELKQVLLDISMPVFILIRPRRGNFCYSEVEFEAMTSALEACKKLGCQGIVSGVLNPDNSVDVERTETLIKLSKPLPFTFHRAFDQTPDPMKALDQLIELGVQRILTSGQEIAADLGIDLLIQLHKKAEGRIIILPGGGINAVNAFAFKQAGFNELHASAKSIDKNQNIFSDPKKIKSILTAIK